MHDMAFIESVGVIEADLVVDFMHCSKTFTAADFWSELIVECLEM